MGYFPLLYLEKQFKMGTFCGGVLCQQVAVKGAGEVVLFEVY